jgi:hypothetical protein
LSEGGGQSVADIEAWGTIEKLHVIVGLERYRICVVAIRHMKGLWFTKWVSSVWNDGEENHNDVKVETRFVHNLFIIHILRMTGYKQ